MLFRIRPWPSTSDEAEYRQKSPHMTNVSEILLVTSGIIHEFSDEKEPGDLRESEGRNPRVHCHFEPPFLSAILGQFPLGPACERSDSRATFLGRSVPVSSEGRLCRARPPFYPRENL